MFCVTSVKEERMVAASLASILQSDCTSPLSTSCLSTPSSDINSILRNRCKPAQNIIEKTGVLKTYIADHFTEKQLQMLISTGFCLKHSPKTADVSIFKKANPIVVCVGGTGPESVDGVYFTPNLQRLDRDLKSFGLTIRQVATDNIGLVTIARSNRDGFVPRKLQKTIENGILKTIRKEISSKTNNVTFDENLFYQIPIPIL